MTASKYRAYSRIQLAAHHMKKQADRALVPAANVTTAQAGVLSVIAGQGPVTQRDIASALGLNESGVTAMVRRLLALGYVERRRSETDSRAWNLSLTIAGEAARRDLAAPFAAINARIEDKLTDTEIRQLSLYLDRLIEGFRE